MTKGTSVRVPRWLESGFGWWMAALAFGLCVPLILWDTQPEPDTANFYARMVREFAAGHFAGAFCPTIPPLLTLVAGPLCALGLAPFTAAKLGSALFFAGGAPLVYAIHRRYLSLATAQLATVLYVVCSLFLRLAAKGLLDPCKLFLLLFSTYGLLCFARTRGWRAAALVGVGSVGLILARAEGLVLAGLMLATLAWLDLAPTASWWRPSAWRWPWRTLVASALLLLLLSPWLAYQKRLTGYPLTNARLLWTLHDFKVFLPMPTNPYLPVLESSNAVAGPLAPGTSDLASPPPAPSLLTHLGDLWTRLVREVLLGLFPPYLLVALLGIWPRWRQRRLTRIEYGLLLLIFCHTLLLLAATPGWTQKRYLMAAVPFLLGWAALGVQQLDAWLCARAPGGPRLARGVGVLALLGLLALAYSPILTPLSPSQAELLRARHAAATWIATQGLARVPADAPRLHTWAFEDHNGHLPVVASNDPFIYYFADSEKYLLEDYGDELKFPVADLLARCRAAHVHYVIWNQTLVVRYPEMADLTRLPPEFTICFGDGQHTSPKATTVVLGYLPHLLPAPAAPAPAGQ